ncbi:putative disease resistance RPP13-like protein 1 [Arachis ipaensis]|uniref:putative disease resistance RPP13-like protein 1 n=1 Tax=Arachis ipaensis TaxID=130454 RepID=UPI000A2B7F5B|nr:putative disease resistance RPP13-like protein 1 [Arachis ipaensis]
MDVRMEFDLRAWICVSEHFDVVDATKNIIKRISWGVCSLDSFDLLQQDLKEKLLGKKFFIVLDDVWSEDADKWNSFITPFQHGRKGSTILLTTRKGSKIVTHTLLRNCRMIIVGLFLRIIKIQFHHNYFVMDDILHELAIHLAGEFHCNLENLGENEEIKIQTRYLSFGMLNSRNSIAKLENLTTSLCVDDLFSMESIASNLKNLRVLSFCKLDVLPEIIGELIRLRYLNLSWTNIKTLPESLCNLYNLQTLMLYECTKLTMLPSGMHKLVKLRHLDVRKTPLKEMPGGISKLENLQFLSSFVAGKHEDNGIQEVGGLANLHGSFEIKKLENVVDVSQGRSARIIDKTHIDELCLEWSSAANVVQNTETERDILESLQAHDDLKVLKIKGYKGTTFPDWLGHSAFTNMTSVSLVSCNNCFKLPSLGELSSLKSLRIERFDQLRSIGMELYKNEGDHHSSHIPPFPSLETLEFHDMPSWEEWHLPDFETFPQLQKLQLTNCPMLKGDMLNGMVWKFANYIYQKFQRDGIKR